MDFDFITDPELRQKAIDAHKATVDEIKVNMQQSIQDEVSKAIKPIKENNDKLLDEKKKLQARFAGIEDPTEALAALKLVNENEDFQLIRDGKIDEVIQKRTSSIISEHEAAMTELSTKFEQSSMTATKFESLYKDTIRNNKIASAALSAGVVPEAIEDVISRASKVFSVAEDLSTIEARDAKGHLRKVDDKIILTPELWIDSLKKTHKHYWPGSQGARLNPGDLTGDDLESQIADAAKKNDSSRYRALRSKQAELKKKAA